MIARAAMHRVTRTRLSASLATGLLLGALTLLAIAVGAPAFLDPAVPAAAAILLGAALLGATLHMLTGAGAARLLVGLAGGALLGAATALRVDAEVAWWIVVGCAAAGAAGVAVLAMWRVRSPRAAVAAAAGLGALAVVARIVASPAPVDGGLVVVGLDGGTWTVITPLLDAGEMPATARLLREGTGAVLRSMEPSSSSILWTTIATGRTPEEHGIRDFYGTQNDQLHAARFWEVASANGSRVGMFQWLVTWPPDPLPGFIVPDWLARDARTRPERLRFVKELEIALQRRQRPSLGAAARIAGGALVSGLRFASVVDTARDGLVAWRLGAEPGWYRAGKMAQLALHGDVFLNEYRRQRPDVAAVVFYGSDALSHAYWKYHEPAGHPDVSPDDVQRYGDTIRDYYRRFDRFLARLLDTVGPDTTIVVLSDHGFRGAEEHQLTVKTAPLLDLAGARDGFTAQAINRQAYLTARTPAAAADVERVAAVLAGLRANGAPLLDVTATPGERVTVELRPMQGIADAETAVTGGAVPRRLADVLTRTTWSGSHDSAGILVMRGPKVPRGRRAPEIQLLDVAPTLLALLGLPVADDMDGRVRDELFVTPPVVRTVATWSGAMPARVSAGGTDADLEERLRALGYVR
jgi:hypothetical protein